MVVRKPSRLATAGALSARLANHTQHVVQRIRALAAVHGERYWTPAPLLAELARDGRALNAPS